MLFICSLLNDAVRRSVHIPRNRACVIANRKIKYWFVTVREAVAIMSRGSGDYDSREW